MPSLVQDGIDGCGAEGSKVGDHDVLSIVVEEKPGLLPAELFGEWVEIPHGGSTCFAVRDAAYERLKPYPIGLGAMEWRGTIVYGSTGNEIPIPGCKNVFVLVALQVGVEGTIGEVEA
jgi:hypothetical protein